MSYAVWTGTTSAQESKGKLKRECDEFDRQLKLFLLKLTHLNIACDTIGSGRLANIKGEAQYFLNSLNHKE